VPHQTCTDIVSEMTDMCRVER